MRGTGGAIFADRREAGRALAAALEGRPELQDAIVLALPRGGVPVGFEVATALGLPLDILLVRKLGVPGEEELAWGAVAGKGVVVIQPAVVRAFSIPEQEIDDRIARERRQIEGREGVLRGGREPIAVEGRVVILVDDGLATGATMKAAVRAMRPRARRVVVAVPVGSSATCEELRREADDLVCLETPEPFYAVGEFYGDFEQTSDEEVKTLLATAAQLRKGSERPGRAQGRDSGG